MRRDALLRPELLSQEEPFLTKGHASQLHFQRFFATYHMFAFHVVLSQRSGPVYHSAMLQGNCTNIPDPYPLPSPRTTDAQCVLTISNDFLENEGQLWISELYISLKRRPQSTKPATLFATRGDLVLSHVVIAGGGASARAVDVQYPQTERWLKQAPWLQGRRGRLLAEGMDQSHPLRHCAITPQAPLAHVPASAGKPQPQATATTGHPYRGDTHLCPLRAHAYLQVAPCADVITHSPQRIRPIHCPRTVFTTTQHAVCACQRVGAGLWGVGGYLVGVFCDLGVPFFVVWRRSVRVRLDVIREWNLLGLPWSWPHAVVPACSTMSLLSM